MVAGELVGSLWAQAQASAHESLASFRQEAQEQVANSQQAYKSADQARIDAERETNQTREACGGHGFSDSRIS